MRQAEPTGGDRDSVAQTPAERMSLYVATLRRQWWLVASIVALAMLAGLIAGALVPKSYEATARLLIDQQKTVGSLLGMDAYSSDPERDVNTNLELITLEPVAESVRRKLRLDLTSAALLGRVDTAIDRNSSVVSVTARDASPQGAARIANAFATGYRDFQTRTARASIEEAVASARARLGRLGGGSERAALEAQLRRLETAAAFDIGGVQVVGRATAATATSTQRTLLRTILAALLGTAVAGAMIVVFARSDKRLRNADELEVAVGRPVLAVVPRPGRAGAGDEAHEALATLAISLTSPRPGASDGGVAQLRQKRNQLVLLLTSPGPGEGSADVALGLTRAMGGIGRRAIAIEADLRDPTFSKQLGVGMPGGLTAILSTAQPLDPELVELECSTDGAEGGAWALPGGWSSLLPQPLLVGRRMAEVVEEARRRADVVLLVGPPVSSFGDSLALVPLVDAVVLVARLGVTRRDELLRTTRALETVEPWLLGTVATTAPYPARGVLRTALATLRRSSGRAAETRRAWEPADPRPVRADAAETTSVR